MANPGQTGDTTKYSEQNLQNQSFDTDFGVSVIEMLGYDTSNNVLRRVQVDSSGNLIIGTTALDARYLQIGATAGGDLTGTYPNPTLALNRPIVLFTQTADKTLTNSTAETSLLGTGSGSATLAANYLTVGKTLRVDLSGIYSTPAVGTPSLLIKVKLGSTVIATITTTSLASSASSLRFDGDLIITCRSIGGSGSVMVDGGVIYNTGVLGQIVQDPLNNGGAATTVDTTGSLLFDVTGTWDSATSSRIVKSTIATIESLN